MSKSIVEAASRYTQYGACVYPATPDKRALIRGWNGASAARDPERAAALFREFPDAQLGIATGPSRLVVIDIDPRNGGEESWRSLCHEVGLESFYGCPSSTTPSGGSHLYFRAPAAHLRSQAHALGAGIDLVGSGGGVLAPPSSRREGPYRWRTADGDLPNLELVPELPANIIARLRTRSIRGAAAELGNHIASQIGEGERNDTLARIASKLRWRFELSEAELSAALLSLNQRCVPPLPETEVVMIAKSIARRAAASVDPIAWLASWLPQLDSEREVRVAGALAALADFVVGELTPSGRTVELRTGLRPEKYYIGRHALKTRGAIRVVGRGRRAPVIELLMPLNAASA